MRTASQTGCDGEARFLPRVGAAEVSEELFLVQELTIDSTMTWGR